LRRVSGTTKQGSWIWIQNRGRFVQRDQDGAPTRFVGALLDITERKQAEDALARSEQQLRLFVQHAPAAIAMFDRDMRYLVVSQRHLQDNHLGEQNLIGRSHYEVIPDLPERWKQVHQRCLNGAVEKNDEDSFLHPDGTEDWVHWEIRPGTPAAARWRIILFSELLTRKES